MKKFFVCLLCFISIIALICPTVALGHSENSATDQNQIGEVMNLREKNSETFLLSDGTYECIVYSEDKYYENEDGVLALIDNSIVRTQYNRKGTDYCYKNSANKVSVFFADETPSVLISYNDHDLSFSLLDSNITTAQVGICPRFDKDTENKEYEAQEENSIVYPEALSHIDFLYTVNNHGIKESVILKEKTAISRLSFLFDTSNYFVRETNSGQIGFYSSSNELLFELGKLYAIDSVGCYTDDLTYEVNELDNGETIISVSIADEFLYDERRVFPIIIDPSIMITGDLNTYDSFVSSKYNTTNYYLDTSLRTGKNTSYGLCRTYIKFDLPTNISSSCVSSSYINLKKSGGVSPSVLAYRVTSAWTSSAVTWINQPSHDLTNASEFATLDTNSWYRIYVTPMVRNWLANTYSNYGFVIKESSEANTTNWTTYYSSDAASPNKPELHIFYTPYSVNYVSVRKITDRTYREEYPAFSSKISDYMTVIRTPFNNTWNIEFTNGSWVNNTSVPAADCPLNNNVPCCDHPEICGSICSNDTSTPNHHKNHYRCWNLLWQNGQGTDDITVGFFGFSPCAAGGLSYDWLSTVCQPTSWSENYHRRTLQHEISHLFGCTDEDKDNSIECTTGQLCIMSGGFDNVVSMDQDTIWCNRCLNDFNRLAH